MYLVEIRERQYEDGRITEKLRVSDIRIDFSYKAFASVRGAVNEVMNVMWRYRERDWDITEFPLSPELAVWYTVGERYNDTLEVRIVEVRIG